MKRTPKLPQWPPPSINALREIRWRMIPKVLLALAMIGALTTLVFLNLHYYQLGEQLEQFRAGQSSPRDVTATHALSWRDEAATKQQRDQAAAAVQSEYVFDPNADKQAHADLDTIFTHLRSTAFTPADRELLTRMGLSPDIIDTARRCKPEILIGLEYTASDVLSHAMAMHIEAGRDEQASILAGELVAERISDRTNIRITSTIVRKVLRPNYRLKDEAGLKLQQQQARDAVQPVVRNYRPGDLVVQKGDLITPDILRQLTEQHLLTPAPFARIVPIAVLMLMATVAFGLYLRTFCRRVFTSDKKLLLLAILIIATLWPTVKLGQGENAYWVGLMAVPAGTMAIAGLLGAPVAIISALLLSAATGLVADHQLTMVLLTLGSSLAGVMAVAAIWPARRAVPAVIGLFVINMLLLLCLQLIQPGEGISPSWSSIGLQAACSFTGAIIATCIAVGAIYILARPFGITTHYRLMELSNPNETVLRRMMNDAPGSYHSSVMVANMAEAAADAIGADSLLTRVAALYHDIGKLKRPAFFVENQAPLGIENVHERLTPKLSYLILAGHVRDGEELAKHYQLPEEVISIIREHHGTTLAAYFYHRARAEAGEGQVSEHDFRYPGPKPSTREAAVVMLADSVQASVKAIKDPTPSRIDSMVQDIIANRLDDGQLENCEITLRDLRRISTVFTRILTGLYSYTRIEYPDIKGGGTRLRANLNSETPPSTSEPTTLTPGS